MVLLLDVRWIEFFLFLFLDQIAEGVDVSLWNDCFFFFGLPVKGIGYLYYVEYGFIMNCRV